MLQRIKLHISNFFSSCYEINISFYYKTRNKRRTKIFISHQLLQFHVNATRVRRGEGEGGNTVGAGRLEGKTEASSPLIRVRDEAVPSAVTSAPILSPSFSPVCLLFLFEPSLPLPLPSSASRAPAALTSSAGCLGPTAPTSSSRGRGPGQNRKCPDMSFRHGQFATRN